MDLQTTFALVMIDEKRIKLKSKICFVLMIKKVNSPKTSYIMEYVNIYTKNEKIYSISYSVPRVN